MQQRDVPINILRLLDVVEDDVYIYLVLELVDGGDFFAFIHAQHQAMESGTVDISQQKQWEKRMRRVFYQIGTAIKWLHCHNVCHLDLSLENALIDHQDTLKIIDFGLARYFGNGQFAMAPKRVGKPRCMSPEVFMVRPFDARCADSWSVGIMMFMMLLGIPPWNVPSESETIYRMVRAGRIRDVIVYNNKTAMMSKDALDLLIRFLKPQGERIYFDQVLQHPFCSF